MLSAEFKRKGSFSDIVLAHLLAQALNSKFTGMFRAERESIIKVIYFREGEIAFASSNQPTDRLGEVLIKRGQLSREQLDMAMSKLEANVSLGKMLVELGYLTPKELLEGAKTQVEEILFSLNTWRDGSFEFIEGPLPQRIVDLKLNTRQVIFSGILQNDDRRWALGELGSMESVFAGAPNLTDVTQTLKLDSDVQQVIANVNGVHTVRDLSARSRLDDFMVGKILVALKCLGLVQQVEHEAATSPGGEFLATVGEEAGSDTLTDESEDQTVISRGQEEFHTGPLVESFEHEPEGERDDTTVVEGPREDATQAVGDEEPSYADDGEEFLEQPSALRRFAVPGAIGLAVLGLLAWLGLHFLFPAPAPTPGGGVTSASPSPGVKPPLTTPPKMAVTTSPTPAVSATPSASPNAALTPAATPSATQVALVSTPTPSPTPGVKTPPPTPTLPAVTPAARTPTPAATQVAVMTPPPRTPPPVAVPSPPATVTPLKTPVAVPTVSKPPLATPTAKVAPSALATPKVVPTPQPAATPKPSPVTPTPLPVSTPHAQPAGGGSGFADPALAAKAQSALHAAQYPEAARSFSQALGSARGYSLQLEIDCTPASIADGLKAAGGAAEYFVVPLSYKGRACYRALWGVYPSQAAAEQAFSSVPAFFRAQTRNRAVVVAISSVRR